MFHIRGIYVGYRQCGVIKRSRKDEISAHRVNFYVMKLECYGVAYRNHKTLGYFRCISKELMGEEPVLVCWSCFAQNGILLSSGSFEWAVQSLCIDISNSKWHCEQELELLTRFREGALRVP